MIERKLFDFAWHSVWENGVRFEEECISFLCSLYASWVFLHGKWRETKESLMSVGLLARLKV